MYMDKPARKQVTLGWVTSGWTEEGSLSLGAIPQLPLVLGSTLYPYPAQDNLRFSWVKSLLRWLGHGIKGL